ncbi:CdaR family protein [Neobacillus dielmonensis]|uniref:CdaR family protein n=1 Tax=Neobacillus dielmonensis TaxID=1347369 RepID=UPI0005A6913D|nr:CdaR family protein [Neobacillus dielmonensis]
MDKLMDNPWFIKILALLLAVLLYSSVQNQGNQDVNVPDGKSSAVVEDVSVKVYYDTENLVVSGIPTTVDVTLKGPNALVQSAKALRNFEVYVNLTGAKIGRQQAKIQIKDLSDKLKATIKPTTVSVTVQEKISKQYNVEAQYNENQIEEGYSVGQPVLDPKKVKITGPKSEMDRIAYVKAVIDAANKLKDTTTAEANIQVLDKDLNKLDVSVEPASVKVTIPIKQNAKTVPINIVRKGTPPSGVTIDDIKIDTKEAVIYGNEDVLKNTESVRVEVDLSKITDNTTLELPVIISNGITKVTPQLVKATVTVTKQDQKTISGVSVSIKGLNTQYKAVINEPANQQINLTVSGPSAVLSALGPGDFQAFIDLTNLKEGSQEVNIQVDGPSNITWTPDQSTAKVTITNNA